MTDQYHSNHAPSSLIPNRVGARNLSGFLDSIGIGLGGILPWQRAAMQGGYHGMGLAQEIAARGAQMMRDMMNIGWADRRPKPPWAYWQFKNGKIAALSGPSELPFDMDWDCAWDRALGTYVCYASR